MSKNGQNKISYVHSKYYIYYEIADTHGKMRIITYDGKLSTIESHSEISSYKPILMRFSENEPNDNVLREYLTNFQSWIFQAKMNRIQSVDFTRDVVSASLICFFKLTKNYDLHERINALEFKYFEKCPNNALYYLESDNLEVECTSYDRKMCYANILASAMKIPYKCGKEMMLKKLPKDYNSLKVGFYRVKITSDNKNMLKVFTFSKHNVYTHISLKFVMEFKKQLDITIELIQDDQPNAYLYNDDDLVTLSDMNSEWLTKIKKLKKTYPKNPYVKSLASATWGALSQRRYIQKTYEQIEDEQIDCGSHFDNKYVIFETTIGKDGNELYSLVNSDNAYQYHLRLKPFVTSKARDDLARLIMQHLDQVIRVQTDSIGIRGKFEMNDENYAIEDKTTGLIHWKNVNCYKNLTNGYKSKNWKE